MLKHWATMATITEEMVTLLVLQTSNSWYAWHGTKLLKIAVLYLCIFFCSCVFFIKVQLLFLDWLNACYLSFFTVETNRGTTNCPRKLMLTVKKKLIQLQWLYILPECQKLSDYCGSQKYPTNFLMKNYKTELFIIKLFFYWN